jgi:hypothetical protein
MQPDRSPLIVRPQPSPLPRRMYIGILGAGLAAFASAHYFAKFEGKVYLFLLLIAPLLAAFGIVGSLSPRVALAFRSEGAALSWRDKAIAGLAVITSIAVSAYLYFFAYPTTASESIRELLGGFAR